MKKTIRETILDVLSPYRRMTVVDLHRFTGIRMDSLSSQLLKMCKSGELDRLSGWGPRGGFGYSIKPGWLWYR